MALSQEVMFQNQLQFNMNVPLTTYNMATHFHRPRPFVIERATTAPSSQGFPMAQLANRDGNVHKSLKGPAVSNDFNFSVLSQDKMAAAVQLAQRDLKNQKLQQKTEHMVQGKNRQRSPSPTARYQRPIHGTKQWENRKSRMPKKTQSNASTRSSRMGVKEHDRNRVPSSAYSQTPPSSPPRQAFLNTRPVPERGRADSPPTRDTPSLTRVTRVPEDDIEKFQLEMELCLQQIESVQKRAMSEHSTDFLRRGCAGTQHGSHHLVEEEGEERRQVRASEHSHRALRTIYNLQQQVKEIERQVIKLPRDSRATKKSQASLRLTTVNKGAVKLLQTFVNQLPQQDLHNGLPSHFTELAELVRQVTLLSAGAPLDKKVRDSKKISLSSVEKDLIAMVDEVERLNTDWQQEIQSREPAPAPASQKPPFVTSFKNTKSAFSKEQVQRPQHHGSQLHNERKALLQAGIQALLNAGNGVKKSKAMKQKQNVGPYSTQLANPPQPRPKKRNYKVPTRKPPPTRKGFLLPYKARQQRTTQPTQLATHFADPTITANMKATTMLHNPITMNFAKSESALPGDRKKVNFNVGHKSDQYHASYPGARGAADRGRTFQRSVSPQLRTSRSDSPRVHFMSPTHLRDRSLSPAYHSDSECSPGAYFTSGDESSPSPIPSVDSSFSHGTGSQRSPSPARKPARGRTSAARTKGSAPAQRRQFFLADADPELVEELFPGDSNKTKKHYRGTSSKAQKKPVTLSPYVQEVERRLQERLAPLVRSGRLNDTTESDREEFDQVADAIMDEAVSEVTLEFMAHEQKAAAAEKAASYIDNPTLENIMQALENMEKENEMLRKKYTHFTFHDSAPRRRRYQKPSEVFSEYTSNQPRDPPAFEVTNIRPPPKDSLGMPRVFSEELTEEPLIFTKDSQAYRPHVRFTEHTGEAEDGVSRPVVPPPLAQRNVPSAVRPKTLLSMKQTVVERITDCVERFDYYQRGLKPHLGRKKPFDFYESIADNILRQCCEEVAQELEHINSDMAENIYTSEFMTESGLPLAPTDLAEDFETDGLAAQNLRDTAAAQRSVEAAVSKTVTSLMLPPEEPEFSIVSPKRIGETGAETSPPWDTSLKHVFDATALYEASLTEKPAADLSLVKSGKSVVREDDTQLEGDDDYDDDYTDISDEDDESESPTP